MSSPDVLQAFAKAVADELERRQLDGSSLPSGRIGFPEAEAAESIGVPRHVLRDCRLRGEIAARKVGRSYVYSRDALIDFLNAEGD